MKSFTSKREKITSDEIWFLEHFPVFTQGQAGDNSYIIQPGEIPVIKTDRGGHVTYHAPGQITGYVLVDIERLGIGVKDLVNMIEGSVIKTLAYCGVNGQTNIKSPGVFVGNTKKDLVGVKKISSLGLRIRHGCSYHGFNLNVDMDLEPWLRINPCGLNVEMTQISDIAEEKFSSADIRNYLADILAKKLGYNNYETETKLD
jgi:lipoyl(octanoyl) transferase|tara:strand:+ start:7470 stop:8075 length:606 start_codon:yes stop_codon:yes gene_type:complete